MLVLEIGGPLEKPAIFENHPATKLSYLIPSDSSPENILKVLEKKFDGNPPKLGLEVENFVC